jgi:hypothetical protein
MKKDCYNFIAIPNRKTKKMIDPIIGWAIVIISLAYIFYNGLTPREDI